MPFDDLISERVRHMTREHRGRHPSVALRDSVMAAAAEIFRATRVILNTSRFPMAARTERPR